MVMEPLACPDLCRLETWGQVQSFACNAGGCVLPGSKYSRKKRNLNIAQIVYLPTRGGEKMGKAVAGQPAGIAAKIAGLAAWE